MIQSFLNNGFGSETFSVNIRKKNKTNKEKVIERINPTFSSPLPSSIVELKNMQKPLIYCFYTAETVSIIRLVRRSSRPSVNKHFQLPRAQHLFRELLWNTKFALFFLWYINVTFFSQNVFSYLYIFFNTWPYNKNSV